MYQVKDKDGPVGPKKKIQIYVTYKKFTLNMKVYID